MEREAASRIPHAGATWPDTVDDIFGGDCVVTLGYVTPASGVVLTPLTNFALRDRSAGTLTVLNSSVGVWKKLERIRRNPRVAVAFHTRKRGTSRRREYVLVQGNASLSEPVPEYPRLRADVWERVESWQDLHPLWKACSACGRCASTSRLQSNGSWSGPSSTAAGRPRCTALRCRSSRLHLSPHQLAARARESTSRERRGRRRACRTSCLAG